MWVVIKFGDMGTLSLNFYLKRSVALSLLLPVLFLVSLFQLISRYVCVVVHAYNCASSYHMKRP